MKNPDYLVKESKHFCILPWIHFHAWPDKQVMPCCVADSQFPVSKIEDGSTILDMMNSDAYKKMRLAMINDEPWEACKRCYKLEEIGTWTMRNSQNKQRGEQYIDLVEDTLEDGGLEEFNMKYMDIRFSNLCNFKCRSCGPQCSSLWAEEELKGYDNDMDKFYNAFKMKDIIVSNTDNNDFMTQLREHLSDVEEVYFAGGEILVQPQHYECLDFWVDNELCDQVHLNYTTNLSKLRHKIKGKDYDLFDYWNKFPSIELWASIDAVGPQAEVIRKGTNWKKVINNLKMIKKNAPHIKVGFTPTVSLWNVFEYSSMMEELYKEGLMDLTIAPRVNVLTYPPEANIKNLPIHMAFEVIKRMEVTMNNFSAVMKSDPELEPYEHHVTSGFLTVLTLLKECGDGDPDKIIEFIDDNRRLDTLRNEDFFENAPKEIEEMYEWALKQKDS